MPAARRPGQIKMESGMRFTLSGCDTTNPRAAHGVSNIDLLVTRTRATVQTYRHKQVDVPLAPMANIMLHDAMVGQ